MTTDCLVNLLLDGIKQYKESDEYYRDLMLGVSTKSYSLTGFDDITLVRADISGDGGKDGYRVVLYAYLEFLMDMDFSSFADHFYDYRVTIVGVLGNLSINNLCLSNMFNRFVYVDNDVLKNLSLNEKAYEITVTKYSDIVDYVDKLNRMVDCKVLKDAKDLTFVLRCTDTSDMNTQYIATLYDILNRLSIEKLYIKVIVDELIYHFLDSLMYDMQAFVGRGKKNGYKVIEFVSESVSLNYKLRSGLFDLDIDNAEIRASFFFKYFDEIVVLGESHFNGESK